MSAGRVLVAGLIAVVVGLACLSFGATSDSPGLAVLGVLFMGVGVVAGIVGLIAVAVQVGVRTANRER